MVESIQFDSPDQLKSQRELAVARFMPDMLIPSQGVSPVEGAALLTEMNEGDMASREQWVSRQLYRAAGLSLRYEGQTQISGQDLFQIAAEGLAKATSEPHESYEALMERSHSLMVEAINAALRPLPEGLVRGTAGNIRNPNPYYEANRDTGPEFVDIDDLDFPYRDPDSVSNTVELKERKLLLRRELENVRDEYERQTLLKRYGFYEDDGREWSYEEISGPFGKSRESARQAEHRALKRLEYLAEKQKLNSLK